MSILFLLFSNLYYMIILAFFTYNGIMKLTITTRGSIMKTDLKSQAYSIIKKKIVNCEYMPNQILSEKIILDDLNMSRTPVRDAIGRLEKENLVQILPKKGIVVSDVSIPEITMVYNARILIETDCLKHYGDGLDKKAMREFLAFFENWNNYPASEVTERDNSLHKLFVYASKNVYYIDLIERLEVQNSRIQILTGNNPGRTEAAHEQHIEIISAVLNDDFDGAATLLKNHLEASKQNTFYRLLTNGGWLTPNKEVSLPSVDKEAHAPSGVF